jgi:hypothetical protein
MNKKATTYTVSNRYGIQPDATKFRKAERALAAAQRREGDGWEVWDSDGVRWETGPQGPIACSGW